MVSPIYKGGYGANTIDAVAPDGESVAFNSLGVFAGSPSISLAGTYLARRGPLEWSTAPLLPPSGLVPTGTVQAFSTDLSSILFLGELGPNAGAASKTGIQQEFLIHENGILDTEANWGVAGTVLESIEKKPFSINRVDASQNFSHIVFEASKALLSSALGTVGQIYDLATQRAGGPPSLRLVAVKNGVPDEPAVIDPYCEVVLGAASGKFSTFNAIAADGRTIFFTTNANTAFHNQSECDATYPTSFPANPAILYARIGGEETLQISAALASECATSAPCHSAKQARAEFQGASEDGSQVFFTTAQPLVSEDTDAANDLYLAAIGCPGGGECSPSGEQVTSLVQVSHDPNAGESAEVQGVVAVAPDGSRVYFVARGDLLEPGEQAALQDEGRPAPRAGADNLYAYERDARFPSGHIAFVADLCSGPERSGGAEDLACPPVEPPAESSDPELWSGLGPQAQTAGPDGRFLVFSTYARLAASDTDSSRDVYLYDAQTGTLDRVSSGEEGGDENGNGDFDATIASVPTDGRQFEHARMGTRAISEDGSRVAFTTSEPLSEDAVNGLANAYEWHKEAGEAGEGQVSLISSGNSIEPVQDVVLDPSGGDVFFQTAQGLVPQDTDGAPDVYDARIGGGFPPLEAQREPCSGDACQGPLTNPAPLLVPGSEAQAAGENLPAPAKKATAKKKAVSKKKKKKGKKGKAHRASARHTAKHEPITAPRGVTRKGTI